MSRENNEDDGIVKSNTHSSIPCFDGRSIQEECMAGDQVQAQPKLERAGESSIEMS